MVALNLSKSLDIVPTIRFQNALISPTSPPGTDFTSVLVVEELRPDTDYYYSVDCVGDGLTDIGPRGTFKTAAKGSAATHVRFVWVADLAGQGWGRNPYLSVRDGDDFDPLASARIDDRLRSGRSWTPLEADLRAFADRRVTLRLEVKAKIPPAPGDLSWFGSPRIALAPESTPFATQERSR